MNCRYAISIFALAIIIRGVNAQDTISNLIQQLNSSAWPARSDALSQLAAIPDALQQPSVQAALMTTLDLENGIRINTLRQSGGTQSVVEVYGEEYIEYYGALISTVMQFANLADPNAIRIVAQGSYAPRSSVALALTTQSSLLVPVLVSLASSDVSLVRESTVEFAGVILHAIKPPSLNTTSATQLFQVLQKAVSDSDLGVKSQASTALKNIADVNSDGVVNCLDVAVIRGAFGKKQGDLGYDPRADVNLDGVVNIRDLAFVSQLLPAGTTCP